MHETQELITLTQAAALAPGRPSVNCIWRWCRKGVLARDRSRVRLRHVRIGGKLYTTARWLGEFGQALATADADYFKPDDGRPAATSSPRSRDDEQRRAAVEKAERELAEMGV